MIVIDKWAGLVTNASPYAIPPGAAVTQVNLQVIVPGQVSLRPGTAAVSFTSHTGSTSAIVRMMRLPGSPEGVIYQSADGNVRIARGPQ
jgi:hypothetical protein